MPEKTYHRDEESVYRLNAHGHTLWWAEVRTSRAQLSDKECERVAEEIRRLLESRPRMVAVLATLAHLADMKDMDVNGYRALPLSPREISEIKALYEELR